MSVSFSILTTKMNFQFLASSKNRIDLRLGKMEVSLFVLFFVSTENSYRMISSLLIKKETVEHSNPDRAPRIV